MTDLMDKVVLITGSSSGIGEGVALEFAKYGAKLTLTGRNEENLHKVAKKCCDVGLGDSKILCIPGDIMSGNLRESLIQKTIEKFGRLDVLVNNAGLSHIANPKSTTVQQYDETMDVNVKSVFFLTRMAIPYLKQSKGNIINVSSTTSFRSAENQTVYCMSKAALNMYTKCLSIELGQFGVRANAVSPGPVVSMIGRRGNSPFVEDEVYQKVVKLVTKSMPIGRVGLPDDIARAAVFLASDEQSAFISGEIMVIDGARSCMQNGDLNPKQLSVKF